MCARMLGTVSMGIRCPIIREGDDLTQIISACLMEAQSNGELKIRDRDVLAITESIVACSQGNYCTIEDIAEDVRTKT
ncbi:MAG: coenzyme F420-0:L-glutamate ligase, partial [Coriobacteriales bacterium]|nr:coenzyme F420-0:L-glutamate ligase [Coriobacteriales bacterium]